MAKKKKLTPWRIFHITVYENMLSKELYLRHVFAFGGVYNEPTKCDQAYDLTMPYGH